ncbi:hypothetical protein ABPG72_016415 [Tetrahymena utriculariae]
MLLIKIMNIYKERRPQMTQSNKIYYMSFYAKSYLLSRHELVDDLQQEKLKKSLSIYVIQEEKQEQDRLIIQIQHQNNEIQSYDILSDDQYFKNNQRFSKIMIDQKENVVNICWLCQEGQKKTNPIVFNCKCSGSNHLHAQCLISIVNKQYEKRKKVNQMQKSKKRLIMSVVFVNSISQQRFLKDIHQILKYKNLTAFILLELLLVFWVSQDLVFYLKSLKKALLNQTLKTLLLTKHLSIYQFFYLHYAQY